MEKTTYLSEIKTPHIEITEVHDVPRSLTEIEEYLKRLEVLRLDFVESLSACREKVALAYLDELVDARKVALLCSRPSSAGVSAALKFYSAGICREALLNDTLRNKVVWGLRSSVDRAIDFVRVILPNDAAREVERQMTTMSIEDKHEDPKPKEAIKKDVEVISGASGLAEFLGCGKTKAFSIIKSGILKAAGIQYRVGRTWKLNAKKLLDYLREHPDFLK